jgi:hypothetical protein
MTETPLVMVTMVMSTFAAETVKGALESAGIPAVTRPEQHGGWLFPGAGGGLGLVAVLVQADRLAEAEEILAAVEQDTGSALPGS